MAEHLSRVVTYLFTQSWHIALLVITVALLSWLLRHRSAHIRYLLWLIVLAKCLVPPAIEVPVAVLPPLASSVTPEALPTQAPDVKAPAPSMPVQESWMANTRGTPDASASLTARNWFAGIWLVGVMFFTLATVIKTAGTVRWLRRRRLTLPNDMQQSVDALLSSLGVRRLPKMWLVEEIGQPFVWGLARGAIYLPKDFTRLEDLRHQREILGHEMSHVLRFDAGVNVLQIIAQAVFWFHPFVWWANRMIRQEREKCCDEMAIARFGASVKSYSTAIIDTVARARESARSVPSLAVAGSLKHIEERIRVMMTPEKQFSKQPSFVAAAAAVLLALLIVPTALVLTTRAQTEAAVQAEAEPAKSLVEAVKAGDLVEVKRLVAQGADVTLTDGDKSLTPLGEAAHKGHAEIVTFLLAHGAAVDEAADNYTPLYYAVWSGDQPTVKALIAAGANVNVLPSEKDFPPLVFAIWEHDVGIVTLLLDAGADIKVKTGAAINVENTDGFTPLYWAAVDGDREVLDLIVARGNYADTIHLRAWKGDVEKVEALIEEGTAVDARDESGCTPLHWAACGNSPAVGDYLITQGADVNATDNLRLTPLMWAHGPPMMKLLIAKGADLHAKSERTGGRTRLQMACVVGEEDIVNLLLSAGEDVNLKDERGGSLLAIAAWLGHTNVVELLIAKGADINVTDNEGRTPLQVARQQGQTGVVNLLRRHGARD